jgi:ribose transport system permease protein
MAQTEMATATATAGTPAAAAGGAGLSARQVQMRSMIQAVGMLPILIILCVGFHYMTDGRFFTGQNISIVAQQASINTVLAAGMTFVILTGGIDLSVGSILAVSAMAALIASLIPGWGLLGIPAALVTGLFFGFLNGALIAFVNLPPFIVTLGSLTAVRGLARLMGGDTTVFNPDLPFAFIGNSTIPIAPGVGIPWLAVIALLVILASWFVLRRTVLGMRIYAVGGNPAAARLSGIKVWAILLFVYCVSGLLAGLGGVMAAARLFAANGLQIGQSYELDAIAAVILGGTSFVGGIGSIWGTLIGALIIAVLSNGLILLGVSDIWQFIIKGLVIIGAVTLDRFRLQGSART